MNLKHSSLKSNNQSMHPSRRSAANSKLTLFAATCVIAAVLARSTQILFTRHAEAPGGLVPPEPTLRQLTTSSNLYTTPAASCGR
jgi:hypothetical protein